MLKLVEPGIFKTSFGTLYLRDASGVLWKSAGTVEQLRGSLARRKVEIDSTWDGKARAGDPPSAKIELS